MTGLGLLVIFLFLDACLVIGGAMAGSYREYLPPLADDVVQ